MYRSIFVAIVTLLTILSIGCSGGRNSKPVQVAEATPVVKEVIKHDTVKVVETEYLIPGAFRSSSKDSTQYQFGATGYLSYSTFYSGPRIVIMPNQDLTGGSSLGADVAADTKVKLLNSTLSSPSATELLSALQGNLVTVYGTMKCTGRGEGSESVLKEIVVLVHPRYQAEGRYPSEGE